jgi:amidase
MLRREFLQAGATATFALNATRPPLATLPSSRPPATGRESFRALPPSLASAGDTPIEEATLSSLQAAMESGALTSAQLTQAYLDRIAAIDQHGPAVNSVIEVNSEALALAQGLDDERKSRGVRGPLHGIPVVVKDNLDTGDRMLTTAGSLAMATAPAPRDSTVVEKLRAAGAVLLGKTNLSEWANFRSSRATSGWSGRGGLTLNPYALDRNACGSSSGTGAGISANLAAVGIGTETDGSITCPSSFCGLVGLKPTVGLVSRAGIIPISATQDTAGPMTRTVTDTAILLGVIAGADPRDSATTGAASHTEAGYRRFLDPDGLKGARLGVVRGYFGYHPGVDRLAEEALALLKDKGAILVDPVTPPADKVFSDAEYQVLLYEFKAGLTDYLTSRGADFPMKTLKDLIAWNDANRDREMPWFGQEIFLQAEAKGPLTEPAYLKARALCRKQSRTLGIDKILTDHRLDALVAPTAQPAFTTDLVTSDHFLGSATTLPAVAGYPHITVPSGMVNGLPVGFSFFGRAWSEPVLLKLAYAFEQATKHRKVPEYVATVGA